MNWELGAAGLDLGHLGFPAGLVEGAALAEFAAREDGAADDHDEADHEADDRADVRLAAVGFVRSAANVRNAVILVLIRPLVKLALGLLFEEPALADFIEIFGAHVAVCTGPNREGDEREEVLRNKHGGGAACRGAVLIGLAVEAALRRTGAA